LGFGEIIYAKIKILGIGVVSEFREVWVQLLITGGVGSKPSSATGRGILVIDENWRCKLSGGGMESNPTNLLGLVAHNVAR